MNKISQKILIIDDDEDLLYTLRDILTSYGYRCYLAVTIGEARFVLDNQEIGLIISDINLPDANGIEFKNEIRRSNSLGNIPFIFITGDLDRSTFRKSMISGAMDFITKPFSALEIKDSVEAVFEQLSLKSQVKTDITEKLDEISKINSHEIRHSATKLAGILELVQQDDLKLDECQILIQEISKEIEEGIHKLNNVIHNVK